MNFPILVGDEKFEQALGHIHLRRETNFTGFAVELEVLNAETGGIDAFDIWLHRRLLRGWFLGTEKRGEGKKGQHQAAHRKNLIRSPTGCDWNFPCLHRGRVPQH